MPEAPPLLGRARALPIAFTLIALGTAFGFTARHWMPPVATQHGVSVDRVITYLLWTTGLIFLVGHFALAWLVWRGSGATAPGYRHESRGFHWAWASVPLILFTVVAEFGVIALGSEVWVELYGPTPPGAMQLEVTGRQFEWFVRYPGPDGRFGRTRPEVIDSVDNPIGIEKDDPAGKDDVVLRNEMHIPLGQPVYIALKTLDVIHSFSVPNFRIKQDLISGFTTHVQFKPTRAGTFEITCAELCGMAHYRMRGVCEVQENAEFNAWLAKQEPCLK